MFRNRFVPIVVLLTAGLMLIPASFAQVVTATLTGSITDSSGGSVPNANVKVTERSTGVVRSTNTSVDGVYNVAYLSPGIYLVEVEAKGFKKYSQDNVRLDVSTTSRVDATLTPGSASETVTVTAEAPALQTDRAEVARNFAAQAVAELPVANRNFQALAGLVAGVSPPVQNFTTSEDPQGTTFFNANGQGNSSNNTIVDGVDNTNPTLGLSIYLPSPEVVEEVHVSTSNYSAEFGRVGGAVVNATTKSGTNALHGSLWEFNRVKALLARDFFNKDTQTKPGYTRNEFGAAAGGPIIKDKTFFFGAYQGRYLRQSSTSTNTVPASAAWFSGDFSGVPQLALFDPNTGNSNGTGRQPFPNNVVPVSRINSISKQLLQYFPPPNVAGFLNNYILNVPFSYDGNTYDARVDHYFSEQTKIFAKMNTSRYQVVQGAVLGPAVGDGTTANDYTITGALNLTHGFDATLLTELRLGYNRYRTNVQGTDMTTVTNSKLGIANPNPDPISSAGMGRININGMPPVGTPVTYPLINTDNLFEVVDTWSKLKGKHVFKWGAEIHRNRMDRFQPQGLNFGPRGLFVFNPGTTQLNGGPGLGPYGSVVNSFTAFLIGATDQTGRTYMPITPTNRQTQFAAFGQDTYQITRQLTLDIGLRYEYYSPVTPRYQGGASNYDPYSNTLLIAGYGDVNLATGVDAQSFNLAPRVGFAYRLTDKQVIRGGYGISYWTGRFGFTGGTLSTQFPTIYNVQQGNTGDFMVDGTLNSLPVVQFVNIPSNGRITPAPDQGFFVIPSRNRLPYVQNYNLVYQRELRHGITFDAGYVGNLGRQLPFNRALNAAPPGTGSAGRPFNVLFGHTSDVSLRADGVNSNYNSLQANLAKRFSQGLTFTLAYAYSKSLDVGNDQPGFTDNLDLKRQYGPSGFDRTHMITAGHLYELPFGKGKPLLNQNRAAGMILGGWQLNGIFRFATGTPFTASADATSCNCPGNSQFADAIAPVTYLGGIGPGQPWFSTASFAAPGPNRFGSAGRNTIRGPRLTNYDFSIFRMFRITERFRLEYRGEFYNLTNTPHFSNPSGSATSATFGIISSTLSGYGNRQVQMALRLKF
ncbi:MAG TPA: TonB-dependent receptor [Candidatus Acidoferrales bacterium]|nr:TonB-dependent receptor [Candidatus Acidoferrales bacterium]